MPKTRQMRCFEPREPTGKRLARQVRHVAELDMSTVEPAENDLDPAHRARIYAASLG